MIDRVSFAFGVALLGLCAAAAPAQAGRPQSVTAFLVCQQSGSDRNVEVAVEWSGVRVKEVHAVAFKGETPIGVPDATNVNTLVKPRNSGFASAFLNFPYDSDFTDARWALVSPKGVVLVEGILPAADFSGCAP